ncbi:MAG TPA: cation-translocating P-type ATPase [Ottowia sp.]|uniref:heavy metal translocating P-type ATPase n=1 Tax=Ottowia sp. TaxID=1898956 RepID=UPI002C339744|nr:cation-translocating P-type ATPase [Ottowia sp.]HMN21685.1 cation-translocating P-type ATPase [Ottowia sp.]
MHTARTIEQAVYRIPNMDCAAEEAEIRQALGDVAGLRGLRFRLGARELQVDALPGSLPEVEARLRQAGFAPRGAAAHGADQPHDHDHDHAHAQAGWRARAGALLLAPGLARLVLALLLALAAELIHAFAPAAWVPAGMALAALAVLLSGLATYWKGLRSLRRLRLNISALMAVAVTGAFLIGQWPEASMVMALYALSEFLEARAVDRARGAIGDLLRMAPDAVELLDADGQWRVVAATEVQPGARVRVKPGARLALDGVVTAGASALDESPVTGESLPVDKGVGDTVYAGTLNQTGVLELRVTAAARDTQLARIIHAVEQAQATRAPTQAFIDRFAGTYTPVVFMLALAVALLGPALLGWPWHGALYKALVLLVIACPCALVIATPVTLVSALARAARRGLVIKGGLHLEQARRVRAIAFDKTGTLTEGRPALVARQALTADLPADWPRWAATLAGASDHPVSRAIAQGLAAEGVRPLPFDGFVDQPGHGVEAVVAGRHLRLIGWRAAQALGLESAELAAKLAPHQAEGRSLSLLVEGARVLALLAVADTVKPHAQAALAELRALGVRTVMLSGDSQAAAQAVGQAVGVDVAQGELLPQDKLERIAALRARHGFTAMVGDGINDAPALASADLGVAMGGAGTDIAMEAADVVVMNDDLRRLPELLRLSGRVHGVLWQNIVLALGIKVAILVLALAGLATMWMAVFADVGASLIVVANGLRLLRR